MVKTCLKTIFFVLLISVFTFPVFAGSSILSNIGSMNTSAGYSEWWYTQTNPKLSGVAAAGATVNIKINDDTYTATADSNGNWSYTPSTLTEGDHSIVISSGSDSYSFTLHAGQALPDDMGTGESSGSSSVPATGFSQVMWIVVGLVLVSVGYSLNTRKLALKFFEDQMNRD